MLSISAMAAPLGDGDRSREMCPFCKGGTGKEISLSIRREGNIAYYHCFRASCDTRGAYRYSGTHSYPKTPVVTVPEQTRYAGATIPLTEAARKLLLLKFGINTRDIYCFPAWCTIDGRIGITIRDAYGRPVGEELKNYPELTHNEKALKSRVYINKDTPLLSWFCRPTAGHDILTGMTLPVKDTLLIVEDQISAWKASQFVDSCALLGTSLSKEKIIAISKREYNQVLLALDSDAFSTAVESFQRASAVIRGMSITRLTRDIKNMEPFEIRKLLKFS